MQLKRSSPSSSTSMKLKTLFLNLITYSLSRLLRSVSRAKTILIEISKHNKMRLFTMIFHLKWSSIKQRNVFFGSSSYVVPVTKPFPFSLHGDEDEDGHESDEYLEWLEEKVDENNNIKDDDHSVGDYDIDRLADMFIASCHEKFLLEKVESYRKFQEMLARSL